MAVRQRDPRQHNTRHLAFIRSLICCIPRCPNLDCEAAHIRAGSEKHDKRPTGIGEKPHDKWTLPLCRTHHDQQHSMSELEFWKLYRIDPFELAQALAALSPDQVSEAWEIIRLCRWGRADLAGLPF